MPLRSSMPWYRVPLHGPSHVGLQVKAPPPTLLSRQAVQRRDEAVRQQDQPFEHNGEAASSTTPKEPPVSGKQLRCTGYWRAWRKLWLRWRSENCSQIRDSSAASNEWWSWRSENSSLFRDWLAFLKWMVCWCNWHKMPKLTRSAWGCITFSAAQVWAWLLLVLLSRFGLLVHLEADFSAMQILVPVAVLLFLSAIALVCFLARGILIALAAASAAPQPTTPMRRRRRSHSGTADGPWNDLQSSELRHQEAEIIEVRGSPKKMILDRTPARRAGARIKGCRKSSMVSYNPRSESHGESVRAVHHFLSLIVHVLCGCDSIAACEEVSSHATPASQRASLSPVCPNSGHATCRKIRAESKKHSHRQTHRHTETHTHTPTRARKIQQDSYDKQILW